MTRKLCHLAVILTALLFTGCALAPTPDIPPTATGSAAQPIADSSGATPSTAPAPTEESGAANTPITESNISVVEPWSADGLKAGFTVVEEVEGVCFVGALSANRRDAWRCMTNRGETDEILDPCIQNPFAPEGALACLDASVFNVTLLTPTEPLPTDAINDPDVETPPLTIILEDGDECSFLMGATYVTEDGKRANYGCASDGILFGMPDTSGAVWTIEYSANGLGTDLVRVNIARAFTFRGDTATIGAGASADSSAALRDVEASAIEGGQRLTFTFGDDGGIPAYEIGYAYEEPTSYASGEGVAVTGSQFLRVWFYYPTTETPPYSGANRIDMEAGGGALEAALTTAEEGNLIWFVGMAAQASFQVTQEPERNRLIVDIFAPSEAAPVIPTLGVGDSGAEMRILQELLVARGFLDALPPTDDYDEATRQAVAALEEAHGLIADGVAGAEVWQILQSDTPEAEGAGHGSGTFASVQREGNRVTNTGRVNVNVRGGPGMGYPTIGSMEPGVSFEVVGFVEGSSLVTSWYKVCCLDNRNGWVRGDVVRLTGDEPVPISTPPPTPPAPLGSIPPANRPSHTAEGEPILYITYDDGPAAATSELLSLFTQYNGHATFFVLGQLAQRNPGQLQAAADSGHRIENHTYGHMSLAIANRTQFFNEVASTQEIINLAIGRLPICLRPPYGAMNNQTRALATEIGLNVVLWDIDTQDWRRPGAQVISNHIIKHAYPGAIVLMHDGGGNRAQTIAATRTALAALSEEGYVFRSLC